MVPSPILDKHGNSEHNRRRQDFFIFHPDSSFQLIDCDNFIFSDKKTFWVLACIFIKPPPHFFRKGRDDLSLGAMATVAFICPDTPCDLLLLQVLFPGPKK